MRTHLTGALLLALAVAFLLALPVLGRDAEHRVDLPHSITTLAPPQARQLLVFAGFPGCGNVCPTTLRFLGAVYDDLTPATRARTAITFVNILADYPQDLSTAYARSFHQDFLGYSLTSSNRRVFYEQLGIRAGTSPGELAAHPGTLYLLQRDAGDAPWILERHYRSLPDRDRLRQDLDDPQGELLRNQTHA